MSVYPKWIDSALCAQTGGDLMYPEKGITAFAAKRICAECPVTIPCLEDALERERAEPGRWGVRGGLSAIERHRLAKARDVA